MRRALVIDAVGAVRAAATPEPPGGFVYIGLTRSGAEVAFHGSSVPLPALAKALRLLLSCRPKRVALRLLPEGTAPVRIFADAWEFARHAEHLANPVAVAPRLSGPLTLSSRLSSL
jgi:hypothetical protein